MTQIVLTGQWTHDNHSDLSGWDANKGRWMKMEEGEIVSGQKKEQN